MKILLKAVPSILFFFMMQQGSAQEKTITGTVKSNAGLPVEFANIVISDPADPAATLTYCFTGEQGHFSFRINNGINKIKASVSAIGFKPLTITVATDTLAAFVIRMETDTQAMKEVIVTSQKAGDTLKLGIDSMNLTGESTLRDILNRTEGIMVGNDGVVSYNGKQITKVLVNGKEVFINQNKIALDNLTYEIMEGVQVIDNYRDKFNVDFNSLSVPVINVKTKARFKGVLKFNAELGAGYRNAWKAKGKAFFFSDNVNLFATSNSNNVSEKDLGFKDVPPQLLANASVFFRERLLPFFLENNLLKKDFNSNNILTARKQTTRSKMGAVVNFAKANTERVATTNISTVDSLIRKEANAAGQEGSLVSAVFNYSHLFNRSTVLNNNTAACFYSWRSNLENKAVNFYPQTLFINEYSNSRPSVYAIANDLKFTSLLKKKLLANAGIGYFTEQLDNRFNATLTGVPAPPTRQAIQFNKQAVHITADLVYKQSALLSIKAGIGYLLNSEKGTTGYTGNAVYQKKVSRLLNSYNILLGLQGVNRKLEYSATFMPVLYRLRGDARSDRAYYKGNALLTYKFNYRTNIVLRYDRELSVFDLNSSYDTLLQSYNYKILNAPLNQYNISRGNNFNAGYYYSNVARAKAAYASYAYTSNSNYVQPVFDTLAGTIFFYRNRIVDHNRIHSINIGGRKGFYLAPRYNKLDLGTNLSWTSNEFPAVIGGQVQRYRNQTAQGNIDIGFLPQGRSITEARLGTSGLVQDLSLGGRSINRQYSIKNYFFLSGKKGRTEWKTTLEDTYYSTPGATFHIPGFDLLLRYQRNERLLLSLSGKALFNVFGLTGNNNSSVNTFSDGRLVTQTITTSRIGYLMLNIIYKF